MDVKGRDDRDEEVGTPEEESTQAHLANLSRLDPTFPPPVQGRFQPSEFQRAILHRMQQIRLKRGHKIGLAIMATAVGKTVLGIIDIQCDMEEMRKHDPKLVQSGLSKLKQIEWSDEEEKNVLIKKNKDEKNQRFRLLFLVHTKAIRDATHSKYSTHFRALGFPSSSFLNLIPSVTCHNFSAAQFIFCLFQSFDRVTPFRS